MGLQKKIDGPYGIELNYHKINRVIQYFDGSGEDCIQVGSYRSREEASQDESIAAKVHHFKMPEGVSKAMTMNEIMSLAYSDISENGIFSDATDVFEEGQNEQ